MKTWIGGLILAVLTGSVGAQAGVQAGALTNATVDDRSSISDPAVVSRELADGWLAFSMPVIEGTRAPCCWQGKWSSGREVGCSLEKDHQSYGTRHDSPPAQHIIAYARVNSGEVQSLRILGESCPVDGGGAQVIWLGNTDDISSLNWLDGVVRSSQNDASDTALFATALHASAEATERLRVLVIENDNDLSEEAVFWLGDARGASGYQALDALLNELPHGDTRRQINFALAQNGSPGAFNRLVEISRSDADPEQRGNALFWLAEEYPDRSEQLLLNAIANETDEAVLEQAVFAVSQLPPGQGTQILLGLAQDPAQPREVRRQAMFWLANSDDDEALAALEELLTR